ncbi:esterase [Streptococcus pneumoniae]|nr:esterase [Streptococcus pneumoniae]
MNQSYFYLKMKEHKLKVPYTGKERRVRILLPKDYEKDTDRSYPVVTFMTGKMFLIAKSLSLDIHGRLSQLSNEIRISVA